MESQKEKKRSDPEAVQRLEAKQRQQAARSLRHHQRLQLPRSSAFLEDDTGHHVWQHLCLEVASGLAAALVHADTDYARGWPA